MRFGVRPWDRRATSGDAAASRSMVSRSASAASLREPRTLPLICSTSSWVSRTSAASSTAGQGASMISVGPFEAADPRPALPGRPRSEILPQRVRDMRHHRVQASQHHGDALAQCRRVGFRDAGAGGGCLRRGGLECVEHLHGAGDHGVVLLALVVVGGLTQDGMDLEAKFAQSAAESCCNVEAVGGRSRARPGASGRTPRGGAGSGWRLPRRCPTIPASVPAGWRTSRTGERYRRRSGRSALAGRRRCSCSSTWCRRRAYSIGGAVGA